MVDIRAEVERLRWKPTGKLRWRQFSAGTPRLEQEYISVDFQIEWRVVETVTDGDA